ncbi:nickel pincer cofactor biosynthesis protein LarC [Catenulispora pinisilvae]|uniref:nickel pincer cofactor biosynthesis protein LarC n=1 Tax=Catenulispora pinisilvae TaxID=2705253 RepID=UPI0018922513|nr:nickel pincer cofactor biosynthesis protein LarC [Catenulispora pinisilvae]
MICWINPFTGLAGDMLLAALLAAGAPIEPVRAAIAATGLTGWELTTERVSDHGLAATRVHVRVTDHAAERRAAELIALASAAVPQPVAARAVAALRAIAEVEARIHGTDPASVHLHELGGHDTIVDVVGVAAAMHALGVDDVVCAPLPLGTGRVRSAHGLIPAPAPATLALLTGAAVIGTDIPGETVTPTGAALLRALNTRFDPVPAMTVRATGYGAGTRALPDRPNVVAVTLGERLRGGGDGDGEVVTVLETNLDDVTGEVLGHVIARSLEAGALDAWATPAVMKKGRPGHVLHLLARPQDCDALQELLFAETGTLGVRRGTVDRTVLPRWFETVHIDGVPVSVKHGPHGAKPEHDDLVAAAGRLGLPLRAVAERAMRLSSGSAA